MPSIGRHVGRLLAGFAAATLVMQLGGVWSGAHAQDEVKIAMIAPISGPWARQGELMRLGAEMAIDEINEQGGIKALGGAKLRLVVADAGDTAEKAKNAAQRVLAQEPDLIGGTGAWLSSFTLAVTEVTEREGLPWMTLSYSDAITERGFRYVFQTSATGGAQARAALPTIVELAETTTGKRPETVALIMDNTAAPVSFAKPMREGLIEELGLELVVDEMFTPPLSDATPLVQRVRSARPDIVMLLPTAIPDDKLLLEKLHEFRIRVPVVANGAHIGAPELLDTVGKELLEGLLFIVPAWGIKGQEEMMERFEQRTGEPWITQDSITAYGDVWVLKEALERAGVADREKVAEEIRRMELTEGPGAAFPGDVRFLENGRRAEAPILIVQWQNGEPVTVYPPEYALAEPVWPES